MSRKISIGRHNLQRLMDSSWHVASSTDEILQIVEDFYA